jgi:hypothetical protein
MSVASTQLSYGPRHRDGVVDALRAGSVLLIIVGHWFSSEVRWTHDGYLGVTTAQRDLPVLSIASWVFAATPVVFLIGGYANAMSIARGDSYRSFVRRRTRRLVTPLAPLFGFWLCIEVVLHAIHPERSRLVLGVSARNLMPFGPLWFVPVYLAITYLAPAALTLHRRYGIRVPALMLALIACIDLARFTLGASDLSWLNFVLVWAFPHQLGFFVADGRLLRSDVRVGVLVGIGGLTALSVLSIAGPYPASVGGVPGDRFSNMAPPTLFIAALCVWQTGLVMVLARPLRAAVSRVAIGQLVSRINGVTVTLFVWHMTALCGFIVGAHAVGSSLAARPETVHGWLVQRPAWFLGAGVLLIVTVGVGGMARTLTMYRLALRLRTLATKPGIESQSRRRRGTDNPQDSKQVYGRSDVADRVQVHESVGVVASQPASHEGRAAPPDRPEDRPRHGSSIYPSARTE